MDREQLQSGIQKITQPLQGLWRTVCQGVWPAVCRLCSKAISEDHAGLCQDCWQELSSAIGHDYCRRCGRQVSRYGIVANRCGGCLDEELPYEGLCRVGFYDGALKRLILDLKFRDQVEHIDYLAPMFRQAFETAGFDQKTDLLVPVPLHWRRRLQRGFNQSFMLAQQLSNSQVRISTDLIRHRYTCHQWQLENDSQRKNNVKGAFAVRKGHPFENKTICLIDDITTSGATLKECAATLREAGARAVVAAVVAVAEKTA